MRKLKKLGLLKCLPENYFVGKEVHLRRLAVKINGETVIYHATKFKWGKVNSYRMVQSIKNIAENLERPIK